MINNRVADSENVTVRYYGLGNPSNRSNSLLTPSNGNGRSRIFVHVAIFHHIDITDRKVQLQSLEDSLRTQKKYARNLK